MATKELIVKKEYSSSDSSKKKGVICLIIGGVGLLALAGYMVFKFANKDKRPVVNTPVVMNDDHVDRMNLATLNAFNEYNANRDLMSIKASQLLQIDTENASIMVEATPWKTNVAPELVNINLDASKSVVNVSLGQLEEIVQKINSDGYTNDDIEQMLSVYDALMTADNIENIERLEQKSYFEDDNYALAFRAISDSLASLTDMQLNGTLTANGKSEADIELLNNLMMEFQASRKAEVNLITKKNSLPERVVQEDGSSLFKYEATMMVRIGDYIFNNEVSFLHAKQLKDSQVLNEFVDIVKYQGDYSVNSKMYKVDGLQKVLDMAYDNKKLEEEQTPQQ